MVGPLVLAKLSRLASFVTSPRSGPKKVARRWSRRLGPIRPSFFATCARLIPNDVRVTVEQQLPGNLSMEDWQVMKEIIAAVRQAIPDASSKPPGAVLEHVLGAWQADAKMLDSPEIVGKRTVLFAPAKFMNDSKWPILQLTGEIVAFQFCTF